jgi:hypothetical protein
MPPEFARNGEDIGVSSGKLAVKKGALMAGDILADLKQWLAQLVADKPYRQSAGEVPGMEIDNVKRAIEEIERLRAIEKTTKERKSS